MDTYGSVQVGGSIKPSSRLILNHQNDKLQLNVKPWEFPGWGKYTLVKVNHEAIKEIESTSTGVEDKKLNEWQATSICSNDILSSCLYVSGLVAGKAGIVAPLAFLVVSFVLYLYRFIYVEVLACVPMNGGSYNALLNTTSKRVASFAASLAILSYIATAVVSGTSALTYLHMIYTSVDIVQCTIILLAFFAILNFIGITESSFAAIGIFTIHLCTLILLVLTCSYHAFNDWTILKENWAASYPSIDVAGTMYKGDFLMALFFGISGAMLGISGFETSSQFVEEQEPGVFPKTLRNMWIGVTLFNPLLSFLSICILPLYGENSIQQNRDTVLANMGHVVGGEHFKIWICLDAFIVLSGAVLTSYVGITGLVRRLSYDRVLPEFFVITNSWRNTNHYIILVFFIISSSLVYLLRGDIEVLSGVYTFAFLSLLIFFAYGCLLLKVKRAEIPREKTAPWYVCIGGIIFIACSLFGNLLGNPVVVTYFMIYLIVVASVIFVMLNRIRLLRWLLYALQYICPSVEVPEDEMMMIDTPTRERTGARGGRTIVRLIRTIHSAPVLFFCKRCNLSIINKAILYVLRNEDTSHLIVGYAHTTADDEIIADFAEAISVFDCIYTSLKIDFMSIESEFSPALITWLSKEYRIPKNMMFIKQPDSKFGHKIDTLGGVRVILG